MNGVNVFILPDDDAPQLPAMLAFCPQLAAPYYVASTSFATLRDGNTTTVTVAPLLPGSALIYYFWYLDGAYVGMSTNPSRTFVLDSGGQAVIDCLQSNDPAFDFSQFATQGYPATRTLEFVRSIDPTVAQYRIEQQEGGFGPWTAIGIISDDPSAWTYDLVTPRLDDLTLYAWRVIAIDAAGNDGATLTLATEVIVRTPDAPRFSATFDAVHDQVNFTAA